MGLKAGVFFARHVGGRLLVGALLASAGIGGLVVATARDAQAQAPRQASFDIPAGPLAAALTAFGRQAGLQVTYLPELASGKRSPGVSGTLPVEEALSRLLQETGLTFGFPAAGTVAIGDRGASADAPVGGEDTLVLGVIDVTAGGGDPADRPYETAGSSAYISREQIDRLRGTTPGDIFKGTPGVVASGGHNGAKLDVNIRGLQGQSRVKVAIDGTQQSSTTWRGYQGVDERVYIDPDLIGGVAIEKGPSGGAQGAGTPGGVVSIRTLNAQDIVEEGKTFGMRLRAGTSDNAAAPQAAPAYEQLTEAPSLFDFENGSGSAALAVQQESFDLVVAAARRKTGNYFAGSKGDDTHFTYNNIRYPLSFTKPGEEAFNTSEDTFSGLAKGTIRWGEAHSLELGYVHFESEFGESMGSLLFQQDNGFRQVQLSDITTDTYTARYRWNPEDDLYDLRFNVWTANVSGTTRAVAAAPDFSQWGYIPADEPRYSETRTYGVDLTNTSRLDTGIGGFRFDYGLSYLTEEADGEEYCSRIFTRDTCVWLQPSIGSRSVGSVFSTARWEINDWLTLDAGLRYDSYRLKDEGPTADPQGSERDGGRVNPSLGLTLTPLAGLQLFARYAEGVRPPTLRETMGSDANAIPNPDLEPETTKSWELGMNVMRDTVFRDGDKARLKLAYFHNDHENYISRVPSNAGPGEYVFTFDNLDRAMFSGIELSGSYDAGVVFGDLALSYYTDYEFCRDQVCGGTTVNTDYAVAHIPPEVSLSLTLGARLFDERLTVGGRVTHAGARLAPLTTSDRQRTPFWMPYTTVDAFASYEVNDRLTFDLQAENLFDRYYIDAMDGWVPAPGRTVRASLTAKF